MRLSCMQAAVLAAALSGMVSCGTKQPAARTSADNPYYQLVSQPKKPEENRFTRTVLTEHLNEPMELAVAQDGQVFFIDRTGALRRYDPLNQRVRQINTFPVNPDQGNGLLGITLDPDFTRNCYIYCFYTPKDQPLRQQVSRFTLGKDSIDYRSERVLLTIPIELESSAHTGGSLQFDDQGNLFISVGDNTTPFESDGFAPIDEREGRLVFDAQRSSGNTNDLRGKILRIHPEPDAGAGKLPYSIPAGNLFPQGTPNTRPEIYVMGCRNPYRISLDTKTGYLYWGEIGPDSGVDGPQGPRGYDEINQAKRPGFYGWPYFVGDNKPYYDYNFASKKTGALFNVAAPLNESPNNTGLKQLPPAQKASIWYPYNDSPEFPQLKQGGRSAMAGPVYHFDPNLRSDTKFPAYYDGALFVFDWMRNWVMAVFMDEQGNFKRIEPFMAHTKIDKPVDMQFGPDGALYMLEYGENYGVNNPDASLVRITFNPNNRPPVAQASVSDTLGQAPLRVVFSGKTSFDYDSEDSLTYEWQIGKENDTQKGRDAEFTFDQPGAYQAKLTVTDPQGQRATSTIEVKVGNTLPVVRIESPQNRSFYFEDQALQYQVAVTDREDGRIDPSRVSVFFDYLPQGKDVPGVLVGHQQSQPVIKNRGKELIANSDCQSCHILDRRAVGPSFLEVAERYQDERPVARLAAKIIKGGGGVWGQHAMSAHPQLSTEDASEMVRYILTLADQTQSLRDLPVAGTLPFRAHQKQQTANPGTYLLTATYTDQGGKVIGPLTSRAMLTLRSPRVQAEDYDSLSNIKRYEVAGGVVMGSAENGSYLIFRQIDLSGITALAYRLSSKEQPATLELHLDSPSGPLVSTVSYPATGDWKKMITVSGALKPTEGMHDLYFVFVKKDKPDNDLVNLDWIEFKRTGAL